MPILKKAKLSIYLLLVGSLVFVLNISKVCAETYKDPNSAKANAAARAAVEGLGPDRGALTVEGRTVDIIGLTSEVTGSAIAIDSAMKDLGARETELGIRIDLANEVLFDFDKFNLKPKAKDTLSKVAILIKHHKEVPVYIDGHTDSVGDEDYNLKLSQRRASSVKNYLVSGEGVKEARLKTKGFGESRPVADNSTPEGRQKNRRVEILIATKKAK